MKRKMNLLLQALYLLTIPIGVFFSSQVAGDGEPYRCHGRLENPSP
jgi:hypothetical protein